MKRRGFIEVTNPQFIKIVASLVSSEFHLHVDYAFDIVLNALSPFVAQLRDDVSVYFETEYVDKVYRDSYYRYYSSKAVKYPRDCIRLSFFDNSSRRFGNGTIERYEDCAVRNSYCGFLVLRPTIPNIVGRSAIAPRVLKNSNFESCLVDLETTVDGLKVNVAAFPSSSQDTESITCAETSLWALMEYYGNKYPEYSPIKPSNVIDVLQSNVVDRQLPSNGLTVECLTYALKSFGFGPRLYHGAAFTSLPNILGCYVESGIPMIVALSNEGALDLGHQNDFVGHAVLCIGHEPVNDTMIDVAVQKNMQICNNSSGAINIFDYDDIRKKFVFVDDNFPPYQMDYLDTPTDRYSESAWKSCEIKSIIAPLYSKIYMEPYLAKEYVKALLAERYFSHLCGRSVTMRMYLCSTRSYRNYVRGSDMSVAMKKLILDIFMPKFVWVAEMSDVIGLKSNKATSLILLDATAKQTEYYEPLLAAFTDQYCYLRNPDTKELLQIKIQCSRFSSYSNLQKE